MKLIDHYDGSSEPFEGDRTLLWSSLPAGALVSKATLNLTAVSGPGLEGFEEEIEFSGGQGDFGATVTAGNGFLEIDFHKPRILVSVRPAAAFVGANLQIDMGGMYVEINDKGALKTPSDSTLFALDAAGTLPGLSVSRFRLLKAGITSASLSSVRVRSAPSNINVRLGKMAPFWPRPGDLTSQDVSPDFADVLQAFLRNAPVANGFYAIPIGLHSDRIARLKADVEVEFLQQASVMPDAVNEVVLPFDFTSVAKSQPGILSVNLPANAQVVPGTTTARILGAFDESRVVFGPTGDSPSDGTVVVGSNDSQALRFALDSATSVTSVDLLLAPQPPGVGLALDLRTDLDGKPDSVSLLSAPAQATVPSRPDKKPMWVNLPLPDEVHLQPGTQTKYWLVVQSLQGSAEWSVRKSADGIVMQHTQDGGLSWRETAASPAATPPSPLFRLRHVPGVFQVPVELQIGSGAEAQRVKMDRFQPLNRVDFNLDFQEVAEGFNTYLTKASPPACSEAEHLANGDFEQWVVIGNDPGEVTEVDTRSATQAGAVAISTDGTTAYLGMSSGPVTNSSTFLATLDVLCNRVSDQTIDLRLGSPAESILLYPDGSKAVVSGRGSQALVDLKKSLLLSVARIPIFQMIFSTSGEKVYVVTEPASPSLLYSLTIPELEHAMNNQRLPKNPQAVPPVNLSGPVIALAVDNTRLYVLAGTPAGAGTLFILDQATLTPSDSVKLAKRPLAMAFTADRSKVVVANVDNSATILNLQDGSTKDLPLAGQAPLSSAFVVISPEQARAFVIGTPDAGPSSLVFIDLKKKSVSQSIALQQRIQSLAITPQGDELYLGSDTNPPLQRIPIGTIIPADWFVTSGSVQPVCEPGLSSAHIVLGLGSISQQGGTPPAGTENTKEQILPQPPSAISQVVPISGGCTYEFSFEGLSIDPNAVAEVLWRGQDCRAERTDAVPIPQFSLPTAGRTAGAIDEVRRVVANVLAMSAASPAAKSTSRPRLVPTQARLTAPEGATAAEVRFTVPETAAAIAAVSLAGAPQALQNGTLQSSQEQQLPDGWTLSPPTTASGVFSTQEDNHVLLRNTGLTSADLVQVAAVTAGQRFELDFSGHVATTATPMNAAGNPSVKLRWLKEDGSETGDALSAEIPPASFSSHPIVGKVPDDAAQVEVRFSLPAGSTLAVDHVTVRVTRATAVPVSFIAQSPGELRIQGAQIGYEIAPALAPPVPPTGLCSPTPPGEAPGQTPDDTCHCSCCEAPAKMTKAVPAVTPGGKPMMVGACSSCGNQVVRGGGKPVPAPQSLPLRVARRDFPQRAVAKAPQTLAPPSLTDVIGIGKNRALQLKRAGIKTVKDLAEASPEEIAASVRGVSVSNARSLIEHAKNVLEKFALESMA